MEDAKFVAMFVVGMLAGFLMGLLLAAPAHAQYQPCVWPNHCQEVSHVK